MCDAWLPPVVNALGEVTAAIGILGMLNTTVQPNMLVANGSARDEYTARFGFTVGCFLKRFCTVFWGLFALVAIGK